jgi:hypothetical protein
LGKDVHSNETRGGFALLTEFDPRLDCQQHFCGRHGLGLNLGSCLCRSAKQFVGTMAESPQAFVCWLALPASSYNERKATSARRFWQLHPSEVPPRALQILNQKLDT